MMRLPRRHHEFRIRDLDDAIEALCRLRRLLDDDYGPYVRED